MALFEGSLSFAPAVSWVTLPLHVQARETPCCRRTPLCLSSTFSRVSSIRLGALATTHRPIRHVHHLSRSAAGHFFRGTPGHRPKPEALPFSGEPIYFKEVNSGFIGTTLEQDLRAQRIESLVLVGLTTNHCVSTTARMAGNLGFVTYVVQDATAAFDRLGLDGKMRSAADVHSAALSDLAEEFAAIVHTDDVARLVGLADFANLDRCAV